MMKENEELTILPHDRYILALIPNIEQRYKNESLRIGRRK